MKRSTLVVAALLLVLCGCGSPADVNAGPDAYPEFAHISQDEAAQIMEAQAGDIVVLDVRTQEEYEEGHIPGAICIPNETIDETVVEQLPDKGQTILVYCRSGNRSQEASYKLAKLGYTGIVEMGGINSWKGDVVAGSEPNGDTTDIQAQLTMSIDGVEVAVEWEDNASVEALKAIAQGEPLVIAMSGYGGFEQVGPLGAELVSDDVQTTTAAGDIVLYSSDQIVVFYGSNSWAYTRLGHITDKTPDELTNLLVGEDVVVTLSVVEAPALLTKESLAGTYVYEGEGFGGDFTITLLADGEYSFYEGPLSSYLGTGTWSLDDAGVLTLTEDEQLGFAMTNRFAAGKGSLAFIADGSDGFPYVKPADGARFQVR